MCMHDELLVDGLPPFARPPHLTARGNPHLVLAVAVVTVLMSMAVCAAAILAPAPAAVVPLVVAICVGAPMFAGWEVPGAVAWVRADRGRRKALNALARTLERLPEVEHPLGF
jgi:hypothetical protein